MNELTHAEHIRTRREPRHIHASRRGNAIVLVAAVLALLAIVAFSYVVRTQAERVTADAVQQSHLRRDNARAIPADIANIIGQSVFAAPVRMLVIQQGVVASANQPRLSIPAHALPFDRDRTDFNGDGIFDNPYNLPSWKVYPHTNYPDNFPAYPRGPNNLTGVVANIYGHANSNAVGSPGYNDIRWLASFEPERYSPFDIDGVPHTGDETTLGSHWLHLSYIGTANNGWRICTDISDVGNLDGDVFGLGALVTDLDKPVEQWLRAPRSSDIGPSGASFPGDIQWKSKWRNWFVAHENSYNHDNGDPFNPSGFGGMPANYYELRQFGNPINEFDGQSARWNISRILADADGDGFTDSFWWLSPFPTQEGVRQVVAVRIIDNSAMLNANVATRFVQSDLQAPERTIGSTPADIALLGQPMVIDTNGELDLSAGYQWGVGFLDNPENGFEWNIPPDDEDKYSQEYADIGDGYDSIRWNQHVGELSLPASFLDSNIDFPPDSRLRLEYYRAAGQNPLSAEFGYTPFGLASEIELRAYHGSNYPWAYSRFEYATQPIFVNIGDMPRGALRAAGQREETSELQDALNELQMYRDNRRKLTMYSAVRNDIAPPWLWAKLDPLTELPAFDYNLDGFIEFADFLVTRYKVDLRREPRDLSQMFDFNGDGFDDMPLFEEQQYGMILRDTIRRALFDRVQNEGYVDSLAEANEISASFAANMLTRRDADSRPLEIAAAVPAQSIGVVGTGTQTRFMGMERQPFLVEAFVAHVYHRGEWALSGQSGTEIPPQLSLPLICGTATPIQFNDAGRKYVDSKSDQTTITVVQIVNPYDQWIDLREYVIEMFDQSVELSLIPGINIDERYRLYPGTEDNPISAVFYSIPNSFGGDSDFRLKWLDFLDLNVKTGLAAGSAGPWQDLAPGSLVFNVTGMGWSNNRTAYDDTTVDYGAELVRKVPRRLTGGSGTNYDLVVVDRFDHEDLPNNRKFSETVAALEMPPTASTPIELCDGEWNGIFISAPSGPGGGSTGNDDDYWTPWARVTRAWGWDFNFDPLNPDPRAVGIQPSERFPRFIIGNQAVWSVNGSNDTSQTSNSKPAGTYFGDTYSADASPDGEMGSNIWFDFPFHDADNRELVTDTGVRRKPTYFTMNPVIDMGGLAIYPQFNDADYAYGSYFYGQPFAPGVYNAGIPDKGTGVGSGLTGGAGGGLGTSHAILNSSVKHSLQMLQKDGDYEQLGELANTWLWGHKLFVGGAPGGPATVTTDITFSEYMMDEDLVGEGPRMNRLIAEHGIITSNDPAIPSLPAGLRLFDAFVCDGGGFNPGDIDGNGTFNELNDYVLARYNNAAGFTGKPSYGFLNINTVTPEAYHATPHGSKMVHIDKETDIVLLGWNLGEAPDVRVAEAIARYRDRVGDSMFGDFLGDNSAIGGGGIGPSYGNRNSLVGGLRQERGFESIGELLLLREEGQIQPDCTNGLLDLQWNDSWTIQGAALPGMDDCPLEYDPFRYDFDDNLRPTANLSTDVMPDRFYDLINDTVLLVPDVTQRDAEEENLLFAGASNMITTRSDTFTVYLQIRSFRQDPETGLWNATDRENIIDDSRYVMLIDRSNMNKPSDQPKILYMEKLPH